MKKQHVQLTTKDQEELTGLTKKGQISGRKYKRAIALLELNRGKTYTEVAKIVQQTELTVTKVARKYREEGLNCLNDKPRPGRPSIFDGKSRAKITALACSTPPEGYGQWSLRLLADKAVELAYVEAISHTEIATILKKTT